MRTAVYSSVGRRYHGITTEKSVSEWDTFVVANDITGATTSCAHKSEERHEDKVEQKTEEDSKEFYQPPVHPLFLRGSKRIQRNQRKRRRVRETKDQPSKKLQQTVLVKSLLFILTNVTMIYTRISVRSLDIQHVLCVI
eukprot:m.119288 g.119288  ORF g.119288 m.119288 type:complete len:139 (+) comp14310_c0_seq3:149-565(+)